MMKLDSKLEYPLLLSALPIAAWICRGQPGAVAWGACAGVVAASFVTLLGRAWVALGRKREAKTAMSRFMLVFLVKLGVLIAGALALRHVPVLAERLDWSAYLLGFAALVAWALALQLAFQGLGHWRAVRALRS
jgi:hypothetical protein